MIYSPMKDDPLRSAIETVARGLDLRVVEASVSRHKGSTQIRVSVYGADGVDIDSCTALHRALLPRLEVLLPGQDLYLEVSSPGVDRNLKDAREFFVFLGRGVRCYRIDRSDWSGGVIVSADEEAVVLRRRGEEERIPYEAIAKAKLDYAQEVEG